MWCRIAVWALPNSAAPAVEAHRAVVVPWQCGRVWALLCRRLPPCARPERRVALEAQIDVHPVPLRQAQIDAHPRPLRVRRVQQRPERRCPSGEVEMPCPIWPKHRKLREVPLPGA